jgi:hypothetical protein
MLKIEAFLGYFASAAECYQSKDNGPHNSWICDQVDMLVGRKDVAMIVCRSNKHPERTTVSEYEWPPYACNDAGILGAVIARIEKENPEYKWSKYRWEENGSGVVVWKIWRGDNNAIAGQ